MVQDFLEDTSRHSLPSRLVAFESNELVGTIVLRERGTKMLPQHQPELGGLFVRVYQNSHLSRAQTYKSLTIRITAMIDYEKATQFIWDNARLLERAVFGVFFFDDPGQRVIAALRTYQNEDGGFGHALEPDLRARESQLLFVEFALSTLYFCGLRAPQLAEPACRFVAQYADLEEGIPTLLPSSQKYSRAFHWHDPQALLPSVDRLIGLVGLLNWQELEHPWLEGAVQAAVRKLRETKLTDAHTIHTAFRLVESLGQAAGKEELFQKLAADLKEADYYCAQAPTEDYCLTPLDFAPWPESFCSRIFSHAQLQGHLDELEARQQDDGGWSIAWEPPSEAAQWEWRAQRTVIALVTLKKYGRF